MMMNKPKKALRGLFSKTEGATEKEIQKTVEQKIEPVRAAAKVEERPAAVQAKAAPKVEAKPIAPKVEPKIEAKPAPAKIEVKAPKAEVAPAAAPAPAVAKPIVAQTSQQAQRNNDIANAISKVNYNFDMAKTDRILWATDEYVEFIRRIDAAQTEAFFLKGKLLEEAKRRFFDDNKTGWKNFCEDTLLMNYTTANQYIRVAQEFDVTSHHRPDFGFEHFKALLPLAPEQRMQLIETLPVVSVKSLRNLVQERLVKNVPHTEEKDSGIQAKSMVRMLQELKTQILSCEPDLLPQTQRWQLSAACRNLAEELTVLAHTLNASSLANQKTRGASFGAGELGGERS